MTIDDALFICYCDAEKQAFLDYVWDGSGEYAGSPNYSTGFPDFLLYLCPPEHRAALREVWDRPAPDDDNDDEDDFFAGDRMLEMVRLLGLPWIRDANDEPAGYRRIAHFAANEGYVRFGADSPEGQDPKTVRLEPLFWQGPRSITVGAPANLRLAQLIYPASASAVDEDTFLGWGGNVFEEYNEAGGQPVAVFRYLNTTAGHLLLTMDFTPDGKQRLMPEKTRLPGQAIRGFAYTPPPFGLRDDNAALLRAINDLFAPSLPGGLEEFTFTWAKLWQSPEKDGPQTVRELSELLGLPLFFPFFPCEGARLVKSTQLIDRYRLE